MESTSQQELYKAITATARGAPSRGRTQRKLAGRGAPIPLKSNLTRNPQDIPKVNRTFTRLKPGYIASLMFKLQTPEEIIGSDRCKVISKEISEKSGCILDPRMGASSKTSVCAKCGSGISKCIGHPGYIELEGSRPMYHPAYLQFGVITKLLTCFCIHDYRESKERVDAYVSERRRKIQIPAGTQRSEVKDFTMRESEQEKQRILSEPGAPKIKIVPRFDPTSVLKKWPDELGVERLNRIYTIASKTHCPNIKEKISYNVDKGGHEIREKIGTGNNFTEVPIDPIDVMNFFKAIDEDVDKDGNPMQWSKIVGLGDNKLRALVMTHIPVVPNVLRPQIMLQDGASRHNSLSEQYSTIVSLNESLKAASLKGLSSTGEESEEIEYSSGRRGEKTTGSANEIFAKLNAAYANLFFSSGDSFDDNFGYTGDTHVLSFKIIFDGKHGHLRGEMLGKRSDHGARSVIIGDPTLDVDQVGVPYSVANKITIPESINTDEDVDFWASNLPYYGPDGKEVLGDIKFVVRKGRPIEVNPESEITLQVGDVIRRKMRDNDPVVLSRQPVLHKGSLMGFRSKIMPPEAGEAIRISPMVTAPFNADFDGDEMNLAVPQDVYTRKEVMDVMLVTNCIRGDGKSAPWIGLIQNNIVAANRISQPEVIVSEAIFNSMVLASYGDDPDESSGGIFRTTSEIPAFHKELRALGIQPRSGRACVSFFFPKSFNYLRRKRGSEDVDVSNGVLMSGILTKSDLGAASRGMIDQLLDQFGAKITARFASRINRALRLWLDNTGFSIGVDDCVLGRKPEISLEPRKTIAGLIEDAKSSIRQLMGVELNSEVQIEAREREIRTILSQVRDRVMRIVRAGGVDVAGIHKVIGDEPNNAQLLEVLNRAAQYIAESEAVSELSATLGKQRKLKTIKPNVWMQEIKTLEAVSMYLFHLSPDDDAYEEVLAQSQALFSRRELLKQQYQEALKQAIDLRKQLVGADKFDNAFLQIIYSGAKGGEINLAEMAGILGQQEIKGKRIEPSMAYDRSLPFYSRQTQDPESRGFISESYSSGSNPLQFFMAATAARDNIVDTNLMPPITGDFYRRCYSLMEDVSTRADGTVRDEMDRIVQFCYGGNFFDTRRVVNVEVQRGAGMQPMSLGPQFVDVAQLARNIRSAQGRSEYTFKTE